MASPSAEGEASATALPPVPLARHGKLPVSHAGRAVLKLLGVALSVVLVSTAAVAGIAVWDVTSSLKPSVTLPNDVSGKPVPPNINAIEGGVNLLLVGSDSGQGDPRYGQRGERLNDVTILLHIAQDHSSATVVSFPRDLLVDIPSCPAAENNAPGTRGGFTDKLNSSLSYGGLGCSVATIQQLTGLTIPFAAEIEFNGVIEMSNAVGGVPVCVAEEIQDAYTGTVLTPGLHVLQGWDALQFLRTRHGLRTGSDLARISNQQAFLSSLVRVIKSGGTLNDPFKLYSLAKAAASNMQLSQKLQSPDTMVSIAAALKDIDLDKVAFLQYPVDETSDGLVPRSADATTLFDALANDTPVRLSGQLGQGSEVDPNAPTDAATQPPTDAATRSPTAAIAAPGGAPSTPPPAVVELPASIPGQTAAERTCAVGRTIDQQ
jgi:LCP family protein required for cell wall assembly